MGKKIDIFDNQKKKKQEKTMYTKSNDHKLKENICNLF